MIYRYRSSFILLSRSVLRAVFVDGIEGLDYQRHLICALLIRSSHISRPMTTIVTWIVALHRLNYFAMTRGLMYVIPNYLKNPSPTKESSGSLHCLNPCFEHTILDLGWIGLSIRKDVCKLNCPYSIEDVFDLNKICYSCVLVA